MLSQRQKKGFIRSFGVLSFVVIRPRRGPTMLNRMCSEAELAVGMRAIISSSKMANVPLLFAPFGDGLVSFDLPQVPFPSVTPHAVKHSSPPSGTGLTPICYTLELRMTSFSQTGIGVWQNKRRNTVVAVLRLYRKSSSCFIRLLS